jgi:NADH-quinone oxidoreductase subunit K
MIPVNAVFGLGVAVFSLGLFGVLFRKNLVIMLMSLELVLNGVNVILAGLSYRLRSPRGSIFAVFVILIAVAEAAVGFALVLACFRQKQTYDVDELRDLRG